MMKAIEAARKRMEYEVGIATGRNGMMFVLGVLEAWGVDWWNWCQQK